MNDTRDFRQVVKTLETIAATMANRPDEIGLASDLVATDFEGAAVMAGSLVFIIHANPEDDMDDAWYVDAFNHDDAACDVDQFRTLDGAILFAMHKVAEVVR